MRFDFIKPLQCCQDQEDGEVDFNDHVDVLLRKYDDSLTARIGDIRVCIHA